MVVIAVTNTPEDVIERLKVAEILLNMGIIPVLTPVNLLTCPIDNPLFIPRSIT